MVNPGAGLTLLDDPIDLFQDSDLIFDSIFTNQPGADTTPPMPVDPAIPEQIILNKTPPFVRIYLSDQDLYVPPLPLIRRSRDGCHPTGQSNERYGGTDYFL